MHRQVTLSLLFRFQHPLQKGTEKRGMGRGRGRKTTTTTTTTTEGAISLA